MDRVRIANKGMQLDPNRLRTDTAKKMVDFAKTLLYNFNNIVEKGYVERVLLKENTDLANAYELVNDSIMPNWVIGNQDYLVDLYKRGVLEKCNFNRSKYDCSCNVCN